MGKISSDVCYIIILYSSTSEEVYINVYRTLAIRLLIRICFGEVFYAGFHMQDVFGWGGDQMESGEERETVTLCM